MRMTAINFDEHRLTLVTGRSGSGKTRWCLRQAAQAQARGARVVGLASPSVLAKGAKIGIDLLALDTQERRRLARPNPDGPSGGHQTCHWQLDPQVLAWGDGVLARVTGGDLLVVDELGVLEFERGAGLLAGLRLVDHSGCSRVLVTVRPALLVAALRRWPWAQVLDLDSAVPGAPSVMGAAR